MENDFVLNEYIKTFGDVPPCVVSKTYNDEFYQQLMIKAITNNEPISIYDLTEELSDEEYDLVLPTEEQLDEEFNYLDKETMDKLKSSDKGKDLIMKAPTMERKALRKAIQDFLKE